MYMVRCLCCTEVRLKYNRQKKVQSAGEEISVYSRGYAGSLQGYASEVQLYKTV